MKHYKRLFPNISYFFKQKHNNILPDTFNSYILNKNIKVDNFILGNKYRNEVLSDNTEIKIKDFGAGSQKLGKETRKIKNIAKISGSKLNFGLFIQKLIKTFEIKSALEMGTSVGIATIFMSYASENIQIDGIEACPETANYLKSKIKERNIKNINIYNNDFDSVFENQELNNKTYDLIYIDGNHRGEYLLKYFKILKEKHCSTPCIIIVDDINWSNDMFEAWRELTKTNNATFLNFYRFGVIFLGHNLKHGVFNVKFV